MNEKNMQSPTIFTILGFTGDLAYKKIIPSLWYLYTKHRLPDAFHVIGVARRTLSDGAFKDIIRTSVAEHSEQKPDDKVLSNFCHSFDYVSGDFNDTLTFEETRDHIEQIEKDFGTCANKLYYLAVPPGQFTPILEGISYAKLNLPCNVVSGWSRILIEKPFGSDLKSAKEFETLLSKYFKEEQIYRIDHYMFKEIVQGIENFRFSNNLFEKNWDNSSIESIHMRLWETIGVEKRGAFYDSVGALRDVGQNHILSMLSLLLMEYPEDSKLESLYANRTMLLSKLRAWTDESLKQNTFRAQYIGFKNIDGVSRDAQTETYFSLRTFIDLPKWVNIPITVEAGKRMPETKKEIVVTLKHPSVCHLCQISSHTPNRIIFRLEPRDEIVIEFWIKKPGLENVLEQRSFTFYLYEKEEKTQYVEEYGKVVYSAINGKRSLFISSSEIEQMWRFIDPIEHAWNEKHVRLHEYAPGVRPIWENDKHQNVDSQQSVGIVGLGKMGKGIALQLLDKHWRIVGYNRSIEATQSLANNGLIASKSLSELVDKLPTPRIIWLMVPHQSVDGVLSELIPLLSPGDTVIDGGNSYFKDSQQRERDLAQKGLTFLDAGISGGPYGARHGACVMIGGNRDTFDQQLSLLQDISLSQGLAYVGAAGAGHFVKMVHNGIEYGMMQAIAEGFEVLKKSTYTLDLHKIAELYNHGSVVSSHLIGWLADAYSKFGTDLSSADCCSPIVAHSGEGQWTIDTAKEFGIPVAIIEGALEFRKQSVKNPRYMGRVLSAMRHQFGGHEVKEKL